MNRTLLIVGLLAVALIGSGIGYYFWIGPGRAAAAAPAGDPPVGVAAAAPTRKTLRRMSVQPGQIEAFEQTPLFAKLPGYVKEFNFDIGDHVDPAKDKPLAELSIPELQDEVRQKEAMVTYAQAGVKLADKTVQAAEKAVETAEAGVHEAQAGTIRAQGQYDRWKSENARIVKLEAGQIIDRQVVDETQNEFRAAEAARGEAEAKVASAQAVLAERRMAVEKSRAELAVAQAAVGNAETDLARSKSLVEYTQIRMPYPGTVVQRNIVRGDFVQPATMATAKPLFVVARSDTVRIFVDVPEMEAAQIAVGAKGFIHVQSIPDRTVEGTVARTSWALGANRTLRTELDIPNKDGLLRPGMYATAEIVLQERPDVLTLPLTALITVGKQTFCCCVENGKVARKPLTIGLRTLQDAEVLGGLTAADIVVQAQAAALQEGQRVEVAQ